MQNEWKDFIGWWPRKLQSGEKVRGGTLLMRRRENGMWIYRLPTDQEEAEYMSATAW